MDIALVTLCVTIIVFLLGFAAVKMRLVLRGGAASQLILVALPLGLCVPLAWWAWRLLGGSS